MHGAYQGVESLRREDSFDTKMQYGGAEGGVPTLTLGLEQQLQTRRAAAVLVQALKGRRSDLARDCSLAQFRAHRMRANLKPLRIVNAFVYMCLCFFERPSWCYDTPCRAPKPEGGWGGRVPMWHLPMASPLTTCSVELVCLTVWALEIALGAFVRPRPRGDSMSILCFNEATPYSQYLRVLLLVTAFLDTMWTGADPSHFRVGKYLRPLIVVVFSVKLQRSLRHILQVLTLPRLRDVGALVGYLVLISGSVGLVLFHATGGEAFAGYAATYLSLFVLLTTSNNPSVMMAAYRENRLSVLFFIFFLMLGLFTLMNLLLATIFSS